MQSFCSLYLYLLYLYFSTRGTNSHQIIEPWLFVPGRVEVGYTFRGTNSHYRDWIGLTLRQSTCEHMARATSALSVINIPLLAPLFNLISSHHLPRSPSPQSIIATQQSENSKSRRPATLTAPPLARLAVKSHR